MIPIWKGFETDLFSFLKRAIAREANATAAKLIKPTWKTCSHRIRNFSVKGLIFLNPRSEKRAGRSNSMARENPAAIQAMTTVTKERITLGKTAAILIDLFNALFIYS